jgi:arginyl-tRNA synthetase
MGLRLAIPYLFHHTAGRLLCGFLIGRVRAMNLLREVRGAFEPVLQQLVADPVKRAEYLGMVKPSANAEHGDFQANLAMPLAKVLGKKPHEIAQQVIAAIGDHPMIESLSVAGPGFINIRLKSQYLADQLQTLAKSDRLGIAPAVQPRTYVIDYSGPNVAKPLHVGHLRSTIIGDALVRILRFLGHTVVGDNHLGDWGTQFGILIHGYKNYLDAEAFTKDPVRELARLYIHIKNLAKATEADDEETATGSIMDACRAETAKLHAGDPENLALWKQFMPHCMDEIHSVYTRLGILPFDHILGESFYQPMLNDVIQDLQTKGIAVASQGALVVPNAKGIVPQGEEMAKEEPPQLVRKRDGAFTYMTTDLATIRYRVETWKPHALLYVIDPRQDLHCRTLFANAKRWGYSNVEYHHLKFGSVLGPDGKPISTRKGGGTELHDLISKAVEIGLQRYRESHAERKAHGHDVQDRTPEFEREIAEAIGIGAMKYADLSQNRVSDYTFSFDKMLATTGNTATYMQYAYARCRAIFRKGNANDSDFRTNPPPALLVQPAERALAFQLLKFEDALTEVVARYEPHHIAAYLWDLSKAFSGFFEHCKVVDDANPPEVQASRLLLVDLTGRTIQTALGLLGIRTVERM